MAIFRRKRAESPAEELRPHVDAQFYLSQYPDVAEAGIDPVRHYVEQGASEGRDPAPWFSTSGYLSAYPDVLLSGLNPFLHYLRHGREEGRELPWLAGEQEDAVPSNVPDSEQVAGDQPSGEGAGPTLLSHEEMARRDVVEPKHDNWWVFPVCAYDQNLSGNDRAVFEAVRHDPAIRKIVLTRDKSVALDGENVDVMPLMSREGQEALLKSRVVFIKHSPRVNVEFPLSAERHLFIGLWHGIPFKRIGTASLDMQDQRAQLLEENAQLACVISASPTDRLAMAAGFQPLAYDNIWLTGLPRHDFIVCEPDRLPLDMQSKEAELRAALDGRRLVLFCPTFRNDENAPGYRFETGEIDRLRAWLEANNAVLGIREHMADRHATYSSQLEGEPFLPLPSEHYPDIEALYRVSDCLLTDYSSCFFDYMLTGKPAISFAHDLEHYSEVERGTFYDLETVFPGRVCRTVPDLMDALDALAESDFTATDPALDVKRDMFLRFRDDGNAARVIARVRGLLRGEPLSVEN